VHVRMPSAPAATGRPSEEALRFPKASRTAERHRKPLYTVRRATSLTGRSVGGGIAPALRKISLWSHGLHEHPVSGALRVPQPACFALLDAESAEHTATPLPVQWGSPTGLLRSGCQQQILYEPNRASTMHSEVSCLILKNPSRGDDRLIDVTDGAVA
jgi:hypothetical protein